MRRHLWLNVALVSQVMLTVFLTGWLWLLPFGRQLPPAERANVTPVPSGGFVSVPSLVRPARFIAHWADGGNAVVPAGTFEYDGLWEELRPLLSSSAVLRPTEWQPDTGAGLDPLWGKTAAVDVELPGTLSLSDWVQQWGGSLDDAVHDHTPVDRILLILGTAPAVYFFGPAGIWRVPGPPLVQQEGLLYWLQHTDRRNLVAYRPFKVPDGIGAEPGLYVPTTPPSLNPPQLKANPIQLSEFETSLFPDLSVVREIAEGNGAIMYTDGTKYLRINPGGAIDYRAPEPSSRARAPTLKQALALAAEFVAEHGGFPEGLVLTAVSQNGGQTALEFAHSAGPWPLTGMEPLLRVEVGSDRVVSFYRVAAYSRVLPALPGGQAAITPESALASWRARYQRRPLRTLRAVFYAYLYGKAAPTPVWCFAFDGARTVMVDAQTGEPLS